MENRVAISTLTSRNKIEWLQSLISSVKEQIPPRLQWNIYSNGSEPEQREFLLKKAMNNGREFPFQIQFGENNEGVGYGMNRAADMVRDYEFVLYLEDDWFHLPRRLTGVNNNWLSKAIELFDTFPNLDVLLLRRYLTRYEIDHHGFHRRFNRENFGQLYFKGLKILMSDFDYCNTPHLRRNKSLYDKKVYPVRQDELSRKQVKKVGDYWNIPKEYAHILSDTERPEGIAKTKGIENGLVCWQLWPGIFAHEYQETKINNYCGMYNVGGSTCKYGLINIEHKQFCDSCLHNIGLRDFDDHQKRFMELING